ncbi:sister chromatid cohesion C-terminus-domain-containing protein [Flagelloscypha sp. PMI_526]|nr:sister chromatid cohesion C-terminus-domain-containing protein [Flagelloscypha sp. PMI_526]
MSGSGQHNSERQAAADAVHGAQRLYASYPTASASQPSAISRHLSTMTTGARPMSYNHPSYYSTVQQPPPYTEVDYTSYAPQASRMLHQQYSIQPHLHPQHYQPWNPPNVQPTQYQATPYAHAVMQQTIPGHAYPTPPPQSSGPIVNSPASSSLAFALGQPPHQFISSFVDNRAQQIQQVQATPKKRKSQTLLHEHESPTKKRLVTDTPSTSTTLASIPPTPSTPRTDVQSVPVTPSTLGPVTPQKRKLIPYVDIEHKPWLTPRSNFLATPPSARKTGDRDERTVAEKITALLEDVFEAEDSLPADPTDDQIPTEFFVPSPSGPLPCPRLITKLTKLTSQLAKPQKRHNSSPRKGGASQDGVDRDAVSRMSKLLERAIREAQDLEPFPTPSVSSSSSTKKSASPKKGHKSNTPPQDPPPEEPQEEVEFDLAAITVQVTSVHLATMAAECTMNLLLHAGHPDLLSEELLGACLGAVKNALERVTDPFIEACSPHAAHNELNRAVVSLASKQSAKSSEVEKARAVVADTFHSVSSALPRITSLVNSSGPSTLSENLIITAVYIAIGPFFVAAPEEESEKGKGKDKESVLSKTLGRNPMRGLRLEALGLIRSIFSHHQDQRSWIIEEILSNLLKLTASPTKAKSSSSSQQFRLRNGRVIKTSSALLLQLIQTSCHDVLREGRLLEKRRMQDTALKRQESMMSLSGSDSLSKASSDQDDFLDEHDRESMRLYEKGLEGATKAARTIVLFLSSRSGKGKATKNANEAEYRAILDNLISDLLVVLFQPEWPAASLVLSVVSRFMVSSLEEATKSSSSAADNNATKSLALDHLGTIAARIRSTVLKSKAQGEDEQIRPMEDVVGKLDEEAFGKLMQWHHDLASYLCKQASEDQAFSSARELTAVTVAQELAYSLKLLGKWIDQEQGDEDEMVVDGGQRRDLKHLLPLGAKVRKELQEVWKDPGVDIFDVVTAEEADRVEGVAESIGIVQSLRNSFQPILNAVLQALDAPAIFMRTKALKALGQIVTADPTILSAGNVRKSIESHLLDSSPQVREAAVELIGKYMVERPEVASNYYPRIAERIADTGLAVRKRVIKLIKSYYVVTSDSQKQIDIATKLVLRMMDEDDTVKDLALKTIEELWFSGNPPSALKTRGGAATFTALQTKVAVIMGVSGQFHDRQSPLEDVLHQIIHSKEGSDVATLHQRYTEIVETLIDGLVDDSDLPGFNVVNCVRTTCLFTSAYPAVLSTRNASTLLPYLKSPTNPEEFVTMEYLLKTFKAAIPTMQKTATQFGKELQTALQPMIVKPATVGGRNALPETVACMATVIAHLTKEYKILAALFKSCGVKVQMIMKKYPNGGIPPNEAKAIGFLIFIVALLGEHCDFEHARKEYPDVATELNAISEGPVVDHVYQNLVQLYDKNTDPLLRGRILQCLGFLFRAHPTLMTLPTSATIMDAIFTSTEDEGKGRLLKIIQDFLVSESEKHAQIKKATATTKTKAQGNVNMDELVGNTEGFAESGVSSAVVQRYLQHILDAALAVQPNIQAAALEILTFTIKQGLAHPLQSFPILVSLETSPNNALSSRAAGLHTLLHSKHATLLNTRYSVSARKSFDYQRAIVGSHDVSGYRLQGTMPVALLGRWYALVREKRVSRQDFLRSLVKVFQENQEYKASQDDVDFIRYMAENFSSFEYKTQEEVFTVIKYLTSVLSTTGMQVVELVSPSHLMAQLHNSQEAAPMAVDGTTPEQLLEKIPLFRTTIVIGIVMLLKAHLKVLYGLSEEKCTKFELNKKSAIGDKAAVRKHQKPIAWDRLPFARKPILTSADAVEQRTTFLAVWDEDGVTGEPEEDVS